MPGSWKNVSFKFLFKCRQCYWWRHFGRKTIPGFCRHNTERSITDCLKTCLWHSKIRWWRRTQTLSTWKIGDMAQTVTQIRRAGPLRHRNASTASLKDIRCGARSQCSRWSRGMIWSYRLALNTSRAAAFITDCNRRSWYNGRPANVAFPKSSFDNTRATTMDWKTERVSERRILLSMKKTVRYCPCNLGTHANIRVQINSQVAYDCGWRYEVITHTNLWSGSLTLTTYWRAPYDLGFWGG